MIVINEIMGKGVHLRVVKYGEKDYEVQLKINNKFEIIESYRSENIALKSMNLEYKYYRE